MASSSSSVRKMPIEFRFEDLLEFSSHFGPNNFLGKGGFGQVYKGKIPASNGYALEEQMVAIKITTDIDNASDRSIQMDQFETEKKWLSELDHPNIIKLVGYCFTEQKKCLVLEYCEGRLTARIAGLDWNSLVDIIVQLGKTIMYIHALPGKYLHGDIKTDNVLINEDNRPRLIDFGTFRQENEDVKDKHNVTTFGYIDPSSLKRADMGKRQSDDIYSFGVILLQLLMKLDSPRMVDSESQTPGRIIHIQDLAQRWITRQISLVHGSLLNTGCTTEESNQISSLAMELTKENDDNYPSWMGKLAFNTDSDIDVDDFGSESSTGEEIEHVTEKLDISHVMRKIEELKTYKILYPENDRKRTWSQFRST